MKPEVTVFMAVYNGERFIKQAINSILQQTFKDFELLIIDDGSTDSSVSIINKFKDSRIRLLKNDNNLGLFLTRYRAVEEARGNYFATLDCDDEAINNRLELQLKYFSKNKDAALCAGRVQYIDDAYNKLKKSAPLRGSEDYFKALLLFTNIFINSATTINIEILKKLQYRIGFEPAEDYDLFERIVANYKIGFINNIVCNYRIHSNNVSIIKSTNRKIAEKAIIERQLQRYGFSYTDKNLATHLRFTRAEFNNVAVADCIEWFNSLSKQNKDKHIFSQQSFNLALARQWLRLCMFQLKYKHTINPFLKKGTITYSNLLGAYMNSV